MVVLKLLRLSANLLSSVSVYSFLLLFLVPFRRDRLLCPLAITPGDKVSVWDDGDFSEVLFLFRS